MNTFKKDFMLWTLHICETSKAPELDLETTGVIADDLL